MKLSNSLPANFYSVFLGVFLNSSFSFINILLIPLLVEEYGYSSKIALMIQTFAFLSSVLFLVFFSNFLIPKNIRLITFIICLGLIVGIVSILSPPKLIWIFILCVSFYMIAKCIDSSLLSYYVEGGASKSVRLTASAYLHMVMNMGIACSSVVAYYMFHEHKNFLMTLDLITSVMLTLLLFFFISKDHKLTNRLHVSNSIYLSLKKISLSNFFFLLGALFFGISCLCMFSAIPAVFVKLRLDSVESMAVLGLTNTVVVTIGTFLMGKLNIQNKFNYLILSCFLMIIGMFLVPFSTSKSFIVFSTILWTMSEAIGWPIVIFYLFEVFVDDKKNAAQIKNVYLYLCLFFAPLIAWSIDLLPLYFSKLFSAVFQ
jgi:MFS family permease